MSTVPTKLQDASGARLAPVNTNVLPPVTENDPPQVLEPADIAPASATVFVMLSDNVMFVVVALRSPLWML
jgi:hypothetical protein